MPVIVSAYFKIPGKRPHEFYLEYIRNFFASISGDVVFFTTSELVSELSPIPKNVTVCVTTFEACNTITEWGMDFWNRQSARDVEKYHTPQIGIMWCAKKEFVLRAMKIRPNESVFIWCDAGCIRDKRSMEAAKQFGTRTMIPLNDGTLHVQELVKQEVDLTKTLHAFPEHWIAGAIMGGTRNAWLQYKDAYDEVLQEYDEHGVGACQDQYVTATCIQKYPNRFTRHREKVSIDDWFKFLELI